MINEEIRIFSLGESALTVEFGTTISEVLSTKAIALSEFFSKHSFPGFIESVPAYAATTLFFDPIAVRRHFPDVETAFSAVRKLVMDAIATNIQSTSTEPRTVEIPVSFELGHELDLGFVASSNELTAGDVIDIFTSSIYRVYMLGFLPGFSYMGEVDERIATPRKETPRKHVPSGSIGIAGRQTGIYSLASPGGWQIIGSTEVEMFTPDAGSPCYLQPGDNVRFFAV